jgi:ABC-type bacteriocin/lantibiotic exporter with double-glycine peptidase domain
MYTQTQRAQNSLVESITGILTSLSMGFGGLIFAFSRGWKMAIVMAGFLPVMFLTNYISSRLARKWENQLVDKVSNTGSNIIEIFENIKTVKYLGG